jgi:hypothetical protein
LYFGKTEIFFARGLAPSGKSVIGVFGEEAHGDGRSRLGAGNRPHRLSLPAMV